MARHFRTLRLDLPHETLPWHEALNKDKTHILSFLTHESYLLDVVDNREIRSELFPNHNSFVIFFKQNEFSSPCVNIVASFGLTKKDFSNKLIDYMGRLRKAAINDRAFEKEPCILLARADFWTIAFQPDYQSPLSNMGDYLQAFLLWDDGGLWEESAWETKVEDRCRQAWRGSGWVETRIPESQHPFPFNESLAYEIEKSLEALVKQRQETKEKDIEHFQRALCRYLPRVWKVERWGTPFPNNPFRDYLRPHQLEDLATLDEIERLLLLDGWLTPWLYQDKWYIQPGSLALLYWAANSLGYEYADSPENFMKYYDWSSPEWFGGYLNQPQRNSP